MDRKQKAAKSRKSIERHNGLFKAHQLEHINQARKIAGLPALKLEDLTKKRRLVRA